MITLPARMPRARSLRIALVCIAALGAVFALSACGVKHKADEPVREGLGIDLGGLNYTVYITRQLNLKNEEDQGYYRGAEAKPGSALYGVFMQACNHTKQDQVASRTFEIEDTQGNTFEPRASDPDNPFMWHGGAVPPENCEPARGSLAALAPASGAMVLFELPISATENRPLELHIQGPFNPEKGKNDEATIELDV